ncbi:MAG: hypothetical protein RQ758_02015 [Methanomicrobiaceae archaeon]|nr:hypothetical protein [Methanomicrobiaceae archaeon]
MTSRIHAPRTRCPGCQEEVYIEELVEGRCPLCGFSVDEIAEEGFSGEVIDRSDIAMLMAQYFFFKKLDRLGAGPGQILQVITSLLEAGEKESIFSLEIPVGRFEGFSPKRCNKCGRLFFRRGKKMVTGDLERPDLSISYLCRRCML